MISALELRQHVIEPTLQILAEYDPRMASPAAINLLLGTAAHESLCGHHLVQVNGPALGIYQCEPTTHDDLWINYLGHRLGLADIVNRIRLGDADQMVYDLRYATAIARLIYWRVSDPLPDKDDIEEQAKYWKAHYNTVAGRGSVSAYLENANNVLDAML